MSVLVVDASVAVQWVFPEPHSTEADAIVARGHSLEAPDILPLEFDSVLCRRVRRGELALAKAKTARIRFHEVPVRLHPTLDLLDEGFALATRTGCTPYDCLYVVLAARMSGKMVTADARLCRNLAGTPLAKHVLWIGHIPPAEGRPLEPAP